METELYKTPTIGSIFQRTLFFKEHIQLHTYVQYSEYCLQLVISEHHGSSDKAQRADGLKSNGLNLIVEHVHQIVQTLFSKH